MAMTIAEASDVGTLVRFLAGRDNDPDAALEAVRRLAERAGKPLLLQVLSASDADVAARTLDDIAAGRS